MHLIDLGINVFRALLRLLFHSSDVSASSFGISMGPMGQTRTITSPKAGIVVGDKQFGSRQYH